MPQSFDPSLKLQSIHGATQCMLFHSLFVTTRHTKGHVPTASGVAKGVHGVAIAPGNKL